MYIYMLITNQIARERSLFIYFCMINFKNFHLENRGGGDVDNYRRKEKFNSLFIPSKTF